MKKIMLSIAILFTLSQSIYACGTLDHWIAAYYGKGWLKDKNKKEALFGMYKCGIYHYHGQDKKILAVLLDASHNIKKISRLPYHSYVKINRNHRLVNSINLLLEQIFRRYTCLSKAKNTYGYANIVHGFGDVLCDNKTLIQMRVKAKGTVNIREIPEGRKIGYIKSGSRVNIIGKKGEWFKINVPGKVRDAKRVDVGYIHGSLLK